MSLTPREIGTLIVVVLKAVCSAQSSPLNLALNTIL